MDRNALLATTRAEFVRCFLNAFDECVARSRNGFFSTADTSLSAAEKHPVLSAFKVLSEHHADLRQQLTRAIDELLDRSFQTTYSAFRPSFTSSYAGNTVLSLVDTNQYEDQLHINEVTSRFRNTAEEPLRDLNIRIAILFEQDTINERENPFRPFLFARAIATAVNNMGQPTDNHQLLFDRLATDIEPAIATIYDAVNRHLSNNGIAAQLQLKIQKSASARSDAGNATGNLAGFSATAGASSAGSAEGYVSGRVDNGQHEPAFERARRPIERLFELVKRLSRSGNDATGHSGAANSGSNDGSAGGIGRGGSGVFLGRQGGSENGGGGPGYDEHDSRHDAHAGADWAGSQGMATTLRQLFSAPPLHSPSTGKLDQHHAERPQRPISQRLDGLLDVLMAGSVPTADQMVLADGGMRNLIFEQRSLLCEAADDSSEQMTIDVMAMLFEFMLRDRQILAAVPAELGRLQFLILKVALRESALLTKKTHPVRRLINRIGAMSLGLQHTDPGGVRMASEVNRIVEILLADRSASASLFDAMHGEFDAFIAHELRSRDLNVDRVAHAIDNADRRTLRFVRLAAQLTDVLNGLNIDSFVHDFLSGTWVHVIERAERVPGTISTRFRQLVPNLLWSIVPKNSSAERNKLIASLPLIVGTVRQGLALDGWDDERQRQFLDRLFAAHSRALRSADTPIADVALSAMYPHFDTFLTNPDNAVAHSIAPDSTASVLHGDFLTQALDDLTLDGSAPAVVLLDPLVEMIDTRLTPLSPPFGNAIQPAPFEFGYADQADAEAQLRNGVVIDITPGAETLRVSLSWRSATTLILTTPGHTEPSLISVRMFLRLYAMRRARFAESALLFERAMQSLLESAEKVERSAA